jgi:hypothetical protein
VERWRGGEVERWREGYWLSARQPKRLIEREQERERKREGG